MNLIKFILPTACACSLIFMTGCGSSKKSVASRDTEYKRNESVARPEKKQPSHLTFDRRSLPEPTVRLLAEADSWLGVPYKYGGEDRDGVDCSALVLKVFDRSLQLKMPRNSRKQYDFCAPVDRTRIVPGDLVFFSTPSSGEVGHVGIYVGDGNMVHASSSRGVTVSNIDEPYFVKHYRGAGRVEQYYAMIDKGVAPVPEPAVSVPTVTLAELPTVLAASKPVQSKAPETTAAAEATPAVAKKQIEPVAAITPVIASAPAAEKLSDDDARRKVLNAFRELPADSILTNFFD